jgi:chromate reductase
MKRIAVLVGSLRRDSINLKFAKALERLSAQHFVFEFVQLDKLPMYNDDLWAAPPDSVLSFKDSIRRADAVLFVTPEYNRSIPAVLKNAVDWGSRPKNDNVWAGKPGAVVGASPGAIGAAIGQAHLRYIAGILGIALMGTPEVYFSFGQDTPDADFRFQKPATDEFLMSFITAFDRWISVIKQ